MRTILFQIYNILVTIIINLKISYGLSSRVKTFSDTRESHEVTRRRLWTFCNKYLLGFRVSLLLVGGEWGGGGGAIMEIFIHRRYWQYLCSRNSNSKFACFLSFITRYKKTAPFNISPITTHHSCSNNCHRVVYNSHPKWINKLNNKKYM